MGKIFSNSGPIKRAKEVAGAQQHTAIRAAESVAAQKARDMAAERSKMAVWGLLGNDSGFSTDSSYGEQNKFNQAYENANNVDNPNSLFDTSGVGLSQPDQDLRSLGPNDPAKNSVLSVAREGILDPESYMNAIANTAQFRIQSQRVRESEQLLNREGPAWDMLENSVLGTINEGSALQLRDTVRKLKNQYAKGGTARRAAMYEASELAAGERAMRTRVQETWQANISLFDTVRQNADRVAAGTASFMAGLPLVNDSYRDAMFRTTELGVQAEKFNNAAIMSAYSTKMTQQPRNTGVKLLEGIVKLVPAAVGAVGGYIVGGAEGAAAGWKGGSALMEGATSGGGFDGGALLESGLEYLNSMDNPEYNADDPRREGQAGAADDYSRTVGNSMTEQLANKF